MRVCNKGLMWSMWTQRTLNPHTVKTTESCEVSALGAFRLASSQMGQPHGLGEARMRNTPPACFQSFQSSAGLCDCYQKNRLSKITFRHQFKTVNLPMDVIWQTVAKSATLAITFAFFSLPQGLQSIQCLVCLVFLCNRKTFLQ